MPVVGVAKSGWSLDQFCDYAVASLKLNMDPGTPAAKRMLVLLHCVDGDLGDPATYQAMSDTLGQSVQRVLFYLEVPPPLFARIAEGISTVGRAAGDRVMVEKPLGNDLPSARKLNDTMHQFFPEDAIYRVDHWLGLDPVESLMFARFANSIIEPILNRNYVQSVQITMAEAFDVADRGSLRWLQTLSIGNLAISVFRRNDAFRDRLPQLEVLYRPPSADTHADAVSGIATTPQLRRGGQDQAFRLRGPAQTLNSSGWSRRASDSAIKASPSAGERLLLTCPR